MLRYHDVTFAHPDRAPTLKDVNLTVHPGDALHLEGPSGSGKTTLLRLATGAIPRIQGGRIQGHVTLDKDPVHTLAPSQIAQRLGYVPQDPEQAFVARTVEREIYTLLENAHTPRPEIRHRLQDSLAAFDALHLAPREIHTLSGGEAARVALACAVATDPPLLLLDEPHAQLDQQGREDLASTLRGLRAGGRALLLAAHAPHPFEDAITRTHRLHEKPARHTLPGPPPTSPGRPMLEFDHATFHLNEQHVGSIDFTVRAGETVALHGPNGSGKTTALHAALGLLKPDDGTVHLLGHDPTTLSPQQRATRAGIAFQHPAWHITQDTLLEEIQLTSTRIGRTADAHRWLSHLGLDEHATTHPWDLSGGERQRMAIATALAHEPPLALLDEPTRGIDAAHRDHLARVLAKRARSGKATLVASHHAWIQDLAHRTVHLDEPASTRQPSSSPGEVVYA